MSQQYSDEEQPQHNQEPKKLPFNIRKASSGAIEMTKEAKEQLEQTEAKEQTEEDYDQQAYESLNSAVYQISVNAEQEEKEKQNVYEEVQEDVEESNVKIQEKTVKVENQYRTLDVQKVVSYQEQKYQEVEQEPQSEPEKVQASLQQQHEQNKFLYPSLMEQSVQQSNPDIKDMHESPKEEQLGELQPVKQIKFSDIEAKLSQELRKMSSKAESVTEQPLIDLEDHLEPAKKQVKVSNQSSQKVPQPRYFKPRQYQQIQIDEAQLKMGLQSMGQAPQQPVLRIIGYEKEYFLKMQTQVYQIQYASRAKTYIFCRRFGDFVLLNKMIKQQFPGFILYPFPQNTMEFFKAIKLTVRTQKQKILMIEQRLLELERYLNFLFQHEQLGHSQILQVFVSQQPELFTKQFNYLQQVLSKQEQQYVSSGLKQKYDNIKSIVKSGVSFLSSYISSSPNSLQNSALQLQVNRKAQQMLRSNLDIQAQLEKYMLVCCNFQTKLNKLIELYTTSKNFRQIESSIDSVARLSTKMIASRAYFESHQQWLEDNLLHPLLYYVHLFQQVKQMIQYRNSLLEKASRIGDDQIRTGAALIERAQQFDNRFNSDWQQSKLKFQGEYEKLVAELRMRWAEHCGLMTKIWK